MNEKDQKISKLEERIEALEEWCRYALATTSQILLRDRKWKVQAIRGNALSNTDDKTSEELLKELLKEVKDMKEKLTKPKSIAQALEAKSKD